MQVFKAKSAQIGGGIVAKHLAATAKDEVLYGILSGVDKFKELNPKAVELTEKQADTAIKAAKPEIFVKKVEKRIDSAAVTQEELDERVADKENAFTDCRIINENEEDGKKVQIVECDEKVVPTTLAEMLEVMNRPEEENFSVIEPEEKEPETEEAPQP